MSDSERVIVRIGLDDTDHPKGGCTTYDLNELSRLLIRNIDSAEEMERRLVRLWPFAERRTRGNAALCLLISINSRDIETLYETLQHWIPEPDDSEIENASRPAIVVGLGSAPGREASLARTLAILTGNLLCPCDRPVAFRGRRLESQRKFLYPPIPFGVSV